MMKTVAPEKAALTETASAPASGPGPAKCLQLAPGPARSPDRLLAGLQSPEVSRPESAPTCIVRDGPRPLLEVSRRQRAATVAPRPPAPPCPPARYVAPYECVDWA